LWLASELSTAANPRGVLVDTHIQCTRAVGPKDKGSYHYFRERETAPVTAQGDDAYINMSPNEDLATRSADSITSPNKLQQQRGDLARSSRLKQTAC